jgi:hypothetical protein
MVSARGRVRAEQGHTRPRALIGGRVVLDTRRSLMVWEHPYHPAYYVPADELASTTRRQWRPTWDAAPGGHTLRVRASDGGCQTQNDRVSPPAPDGATGHHTIRISVT